MKHVDMSFIPDQEVGEWKITTSEVKPRELGEYINLVKTGRGFIQGGSVKLLHRGRTLVMSNTSDEINDFRPFVQKAKGYVLINGLGLGCLVKVLLEKTEPRIERITVIEKSAEVIEMVAKHFQDPRLEVIHEDCFLYQPKQKYDCVWHDIWDTITSDNLLEMKILHRKYAKRTRYQDSWAKKICLRLRREEKAVSY